MMTAMEDPLLADALRAMPIFGHLPEESDACFAALRRGAICDFGRGDLVLSRNEDDHAVFLIQGAVRSGEDGAPISAPGAYFGVFELIAHRGIDRDLVAVGRVRAFQLQRDALDELLNACPNLVTHLLTDCAKRLLAKENYHD